MCKLRSKFSECISACCLCNLCHVLTPLLKFFYQFFDFLLIYMIEQLALDKLCARCGWLQFLYGVSESASAGCCEQHNLLACEIILLQECVDDRWCYVPSDWESKEYLVIL